MKMGLREANQNFSKAIKAVKAGKAIVLTERGKPIATIQPIAHQPDGDELQPLRNEGFLIGRQNRRVLPASAKPIRVAGLSISQALRKERDED